MTCPRPYIFGIVFCTLAVGLIWLAVVEHGRREQRAAAEVVARAPHITSAGLRAAFAQNARAAARRFDGRVIVVTGTVGGEDEGLLGDGCIWMGDIACDVGGRYGSAAVTQTATVVGRCDGLQAGGMIRLSDARVIDTVRSQQ